METNAGEIEQDRELAPPEEEKLAATHVVGVGASAGGLEALEKFFANVPPDSGCAYVVIQHLSPDFKSMMDELLARHTKLPIHHVEEGMQVEPNGIYLMPPRKNMALRHGILQLTDQDLSGGLNMPIDIFFRSMAQDLGEHCISVVLSGTGTDGSRGIRDVHEAGGLVLVQDRESAGFDGMPRSAIATGCAHAVSRPDAMPDIILEHLRSKGGEARPKTHQSLLSEILGLFRLRYGINFAKYKPTTIQRRIDRRTSLTACDDLETYYELLQNDEVELDHLYRDLLIEVTRFFRDPQAFTVLREKVVPGIVERAAEEKEVRIWVPGCATGEEAYSIAMLVHDAMERAGRMGTCKIFATDVHRSSLEIASAGIYSDAALENVPEELARRFFIPHGDQRHQIAPSVRRMVVCAPHNLCDDPPFTKLDLISCRNVLIYLLPEVQRDVLTMFHFGLNVGGHLFLGPSETVGDLSNELATVEKHYRLFRKVREVRLSDVHRIPLAHAPRPRKAQGSAPSAPQESDPVAKTVFDDLLDKYVPPSLLVNENGELVHSFGDARGILKQPRGRPTLDVTKMIDGDLRLAISTGLHRSSREKKTVVFEGVRGGTAEEPHYYRLVIEPYKKRWYELFLVIFEDAMPPARVQPPAESLAADAELSDHVGRLERELDYTRESLQSTVEELETSNEELQATNEELVASNEELQSTNEELNSVNEELHTVNAEHQRQIEELKQMTSDMDNLLRNTNIGTIFLDGHLRIRKFTPAIQSAFNVMDQDVGRPIEHYAYKLDNPELMDDIRAVLKDHEPREREVRDPEGGTYLQRIRPYLADNDDSEGVVLTFTDISDLNAVRELQARILQVEQANTELQEFAYAVSHDMRVPMRRILQLERLLRDEAVDADLPAEHLEHLQSIGRASEHLEEMFDCLLDYSRVTTRGGPIRETPLNGCLDPAIQRITNRYPKADGAITFDVLPTVPVDEDQITELFVQLLDNAFKFNRSEIPRVHVSAMLVDESWEILVRDNGPGIPVDRADRAFVIFERLDADRGVPGLGAGLAVCKRIAERHGGSMEVRPAVAGATLVVHLPAAGPERGK